MKKRIAKIEVINSGSPPDVDSDFSTIHREDAIAHVTEVYGKDNVANIVTFGTLAGKAAFKQMCTIYGVNFVQANKITKLYPPMVQGKTPTLANIYDPHHPRYEEGADFREAVSDPEWEKIIKGALAIEGRNKSWGVHACGIVMSSEPLSDVIPMMVRPKDQRVITQWTYPECESLGLIKMDFLGLDTVDIVQHSVENIIKMGKTPPDMIELIHGPMDDPEVYKLFQEGNTIGIFQFGSDMVRQLLLLAKPTEFADLPAITSVARPGPMGMKSHIKYADRKNGRESIDYIHPGFAGTIMEDVLGPTYGLILYQEQVQKISNQIAGMTLQEGDDLRRAMGKKKKDVMESMKPKFYDGALKNGFSEEAVDELWSTLLPFSEYGFNKCLSGETLIALPHQETESIESLYSRFNNGEKNIEILSMFENGQVQPHKIKNIVQTGIKPLFNIKTENGKTIKVTKEHRLLTTDGYGTIDNGQLTVGKEIIVDSDWDSRTSHETHHAQNMNSSVQISARQEKAQQNMAVYQKLLLPMEFSQDFALPAVLSDGRVVDSIAKAAAAEYLLSRGIDFEIDKAFDNDQTKIADFFVRGIYFVMDGSNNVRDHFTQQKNDSPTSVVYLTPQNFGDEIDNALMLHMTQGDRIVEIIEADVSELTYDIQMETTGPANFIANGIVSHNSHAVAYAMNSYQSAYLKVHYPVEFMSAIIAQHVDNKDKAMMYLRDAKRMGLKVGSANINLSESRVAPNYKKANKDENDIIFGLAGIKSVSDTMADIIIKERDDNGLYTSVKDVIDRCYPLGVDKRTVYENLALAGAFDCFDVSRKAVYENIVNLLDSSKISTKKGEDLFAMFEVNDESLNIDLTGNDFPFLERLKKEASMVGLYLSAHPADRVNNLLLKESSMSIDKILSMNRSVKTTVVGSILGINVKRSKRGAKTMSLDIDDGTGYMTAYVGKSIVEGIDKYDAQQKIRTVYETGNGSLAPEILDKATDNMTNTVKNIELYGLYVMDITYHPGNGEDSTYRAQVNSIKLLPLADNGSLPVRIRFKHTANNADKMKKLIKALPLNLHNKLPGEYPIHVASYSEEDVYVDEQVLFQTAYDEITASGDEPVERIWPPAVKKQSKNHPSQNHIAQAIENLEYENTGYSTDKSQKVEQAIEKFVGYGAYDFGVFNPDSLDEN